MASYEVVMNAKPVIVVEDADDEQDAITQAEAAMQVMQPPARWLCHVRDWYVTGEVIATFSQQRKDG